MGRRVILNMTDKHADRHLAVSLWSVYVPAHLPLDLSTCLLIFIRPYEVITLCPAFG